VSKSLLSFCVIDVSNIEMSTIHAQKETLKKYKLGQKSKKDDDSYGKTVLNLN